MDLNYVAIVLAVIAQFVSGFVWYGPLFGKLWGEMHGFNKLSKEVQEKMMKEMGPMYGFQMVVTVISTFVLAIFITSFSGWNPYGMAALFWFGFTVPAQVSSVLFSNTEKKWMLKKVLILAGGSLISLELAAAVLSMMM